MAPPSQQHLVNIHQLPTASSSVLAHSLQAIGLGGIRLRRLEIKTEHVQVMMGMMGMVTWAIPHEEIATIWVSVKTYYYQC